MILASTLELLWHLIGLMTGRLERRRREKNLTGSLRANENVRRLRARSCGQPSQVAGIGYL